PIYPAPTLVRSEHGRGDRRQPLPAGRGPHPQRVLLGALAPLPEAVDRQQAEQDLLERVAGDVRADGGGEQQDGAGELDRPGPDGLAHGEHHGRQGADVADQIGPPHRQTEDLDRCVRPAHRAPTSLSTYFAITSTSMFTRSPGCRSPRVVSLSVVGMRLTPKLPSSTVVTVRLIPSTAIEPFSATYLPREAGR